MLLAVQAGIEKLAPVGIPVGIRVELRTNPAHVVAQPPPQILVGLRSEIPVQQRPCFGVRISKPEAATGNVLAGNNCADELTPRFRWFHHLPGLCTLALHVGPELTNNPERIPEGLPMKPKCSSGHYISHREITSTS